jgi:pimeloyl-ACP methyl ester carboxylesterase
MEHGTRDIAPRRHPYASAVSSAEPMRAAPDSMVVPLQGGERIHYLDWDVDGVKGGRPIVLVHGLARTAWTWQPVARRLEVAHPVVAPDLRGHGGSDAPRHGYDLERLALDVLTVIAGKGWGQAVGGPPAVVAGHGLGAMLAVEMARLEPASVAGLVLVDAGWEEMLEATRMLPMQLVEAMAEPPETMASMEAWLADRRAFDPSSWDDDQEVAARAEVVEKHAGHVGLVTRSSVIRKTVEAMYAYRPREALAQAWCPVTLLVAGASSADDEERRERLLAIEDSQRSRTDAGLGPMRIRHVPGAGHDLMRHRPADVAEELELLSATPDGH